MALIRKTNAKLTTFAIKMFLLLIFVSIGTGFSWATGNIKGNLDSDEHSFIDRIFYPMLVESKICTSAEKDCKNGNYIICLSINGLSCDVYGITDKTLITKFFLAMLNSGLKISSFTFWESKYHEKTLFEKPLLSYTNRIGDDLK